MLGRIVFQGMGARAVIARIPLAMMPLQVARISTTPLMAKAAASKPKTTASKPKTTTTKRTTKKSDSIKTSRAAKVDKPWVSRDEQGNILPLPLETKPKRRTSFLIYFAERLPKLKERSEFRKVSQSTGKDVVDVTAVTTAVGKEWQELGTQEKHRIEKLAEDNKKQYEKAMHAWQKSLTPNDIRRQNLYLAHQRKLGKSVPSNLRDPSAPKRPPGAFFLYVQHLRDNGKVSGLAQEISREAGAKWKSLSAKEKEPFEKRAHDQYDAYAKQMDKYKKVHP
ncbi:hypothetical protein MVES1_003745 [Malassezia vespertilionis]|uniref:HMG box domain-containing protein n=1 Tax=Malassezia vespertilionis TaxID=2020962 RepID=A0A2N1J8G9_9BASI|nr:uncharacterized protein MVES1_003745 [Malassezia vespertilionis]PKI82843.1 hypothetical protein MVES_003303 [Malassezia vespertilionis]WFD08373.1 hypothetical protein MVES1_003745 [Malassezia vespertilionis]